MLNVFVRSLLIYGVVVLVMRIMGKRQIGQLQPFELVIAILIAELAGIPMEDVSIPLVKGLVPIFALTLSQVTLSYIILKSEKVRALVCGSPSVIIRNGVIQQNELRRQRMNLSDLMEELRAKNVSNIQDVEFAILETNGALSVFPKSDRKPVTLKDMQLPGKPEDIPTVLISDGHIIHKNLINANLDIKWLKEELSKRGLNAREVFLAYMDPQNSLQVIAKQRS